MNAPARLAVYAAGLALVLGAGAAVGAAVGPIDSATRPAHGVDPTPAATSAGAGGGPDGHGVGAQGGTVHPGASSADVPAVTTTPSAPSGPGAPAPVAHPDGGEDGH